MNKKEMLNEINKIKKELLGLDFDTQLAIYRRRDELLNESKVNVTGCGKIRYYLTKNAKYEEVEDFLTQLINAVYDVCGHWY